MVRSTTTTVALTLLACLTTACTEAPLDEDDDGIIDGTTGAPATTTAPGSGSDDGDATEPDNTTQLDGGDCEPACEPGQVCEDGACIDELGCDPPCADGEVCEDSMCIPGPGACDPPCVDGEVCEDSVCVVPSSGPYGDCVNGQQCEEGLDCISDEGQTIGWCGVLECASDDECQPPATGDAPAVCAPINDTTDACMLDCSAGQGCPSGMFCLGESICVWPVELPGFGVGYGDCVDNPVETCGAGTTCLVDDVVEPSVGVCSHVGCVDVAQCPSAPPTGDAVVTCGNLTGEAETCYLDCAGGETCPDGMECFADTLCMWPDEGFVLDEDFEWLTDFRPGWTLVDVDGNTPADDVDFVDDAWVVSVESGGTNWAAVSTSWYEPVNQADDWMISPQITLGAASVLSWTSRVEDPEFLDGYEVRISTAGFDPGDFLANPAIFTIIDDVEVFTPHTVDLAAAGYMDQDVYIAFRNNSDDEFLLFVDDIHITE